MNSRPPKFEVRIAISDAQIEAAQRLRYAVFVEELHGDGPMVDHDARLERDRFDPFATHLTLHDLHRTDGENVVGAYRLMTGAQADAAGQFYCDDEFDLTPLRRSGHRLLELERSCLHPDYRGGEGMMHLWSALGKYVAQNNIELLFGVASFHGVDAHALAEPLSLLHDRHLAPEELRVTPLASAAQSMDLIPPDEINRVVALRATPALIKAYLRLGGVVGDGAFVDHAFNTTDICLILSTDAVGQMQRRFLEGGLGNG